VKRHGERSNRSRSVSNSRATTCSRSGPLAVRTSTLTSNLKGYEGMRRPAARGWLGNELRWPRDVVARPKRTLQPGPEEQVGGWITSVDIGWLSDQWDL
jgi:hypothetical protein